MKRSTKLKLHFGLWSLMYLLLFVPIIIQEDGVSSIPFVLNMFGTVTFILILPGALMFYLFYSFLYPKYFKNRNYKGLVLIGGSVITLLSLLNPLIRHIVLELDIDTLNFFDWISIRFYFYAFGWLTLFGILGVFLRGFIERFEEKQKNEELLRRNKEMELALVKAKINPHFLFNTINNIDVLINKDSTKASAYLNKLSDLLRFMLYKNDDEKIKLDLEIDNIQKYIELQKLRTTNEDYVRFTVEGNTSIFEVAPMLFIPFIENAFKHASNKKAKHAIQISMNADKKELTFECQNKYELDLQTEKADSGLGNSLIKKRLELIYPDSHQLKIERKEGVYRVLLKLKF